VNQPSLFDDGTPRRAVDTIIVYSDGGARGNPGPAAIGAVVLDATDDPPKRVATISERIGETTNNVAEYRALIAGLEAAEPFRARRVQVFADSMLVVQQLRGQWKVKQAHLRPLVDRARELLATYEVAELQHIAREYNTDADALVNAALDAP
jgi:ribonuclease HI